MTTAGPTEDTTAAGAPIQLACMSWPYNGHSLERALEGIAAAGFRYVSLGLPHQGRAAIDDSAPGEAVRVRSLLAQHGLTPTTYVSNDALAPSQSIDAARRRMDFVQELGVSELLTVGVSSYRRFPAEPVPDSEMAKRHHDFVERYRQHGEEAERRGLVVSIKPHTGNTATAQTVVDTLTDIGSPAVRGCYDAGNVRFYEGIDPAQDFPAMLQHTVSFIAKDHAGARAEANFPVPGEGECDFADMFAQLRRVDFSGPVIIERLDGTGAELSGDEIDQRVARSHRNVTQLLAGAGFTIAQPVM